MRIVLTVAEVRDGPRGCVWRAALRPERYMPDVSVAFPRGENDLRVMRTRLSNA